MFEQKSSTSLFEISPWYIILTEFSMGLVMVLFRIEILYYVCISRLIYKRSIPNYYVFVFYYNIFHDYPLVQY